MQQGCEPVAVYDAVTGEYQGWAWPELVGAAEVAPGGLVFLDRRRRIIPPAEASRSWLQPVRRLFVAGGPVFSSEGPRRPLPA